MNKKGCKQMPRPRRSPALPEVAARQRGTDPEVPHASASKAAAEI